MGRKLKIGGGFMIIASRYMQSIPYDESSSIIWHSIFGRPMLISNEIAEILSKYSENQECFNINDLFSPDYDKDEIKEATQLLCKANILLPGNTTSEGYNEDYYIEKIFEKHNVSAGNKIKNLSLIMSEECPFRCKYCIHFANSNHQYNPEKKMSFKIAKDSIDYYLESISSRHLKKAYINFGGGEPLLNWKIIKQLLPYIKECSNKFGIPIKIGINTNLALLTIDIAKTLIQYGVEIAASLDGTKNGNDAVRLTKDLGGTYDQIIRGFDIMRELNHPLDGFAMTVTEDNFSDIDTPLVDWAASRGMSEIRIDIDVVGAVDIPIDEIVSKLVKVRQYAKTKGISVIGFWSRPAENLGLTPEEEDVGFCGGERGNSICIAPSGQVFPCGYSNYELGKYTEIPHIFTKKTYLDLISHRNILNLSECKDCPILGFCRGGCMITKETAENAPSKFSRMCELYLAMTYEILRESVEG